ncbi:MAG: MliC family protein [Hyphomonas sp.]
MKRLVMLIAAAPLLLAGCTIQSGFGFGGARATAPDPVHISDVIEPLTWPRPVPDEPLAFSSIFECGDQTAEIGTLTIQSYGDLRAGAQPRITGHTVLRADGTEYRLKPVETASGSKYVSQGQGPQTSFWNKGQEGLLVLQGVEHSGCVRIGGYHE